MAVIVWDLIAHEQVKEYFGIDFCSVFNIRDSGRCISLILQTVTIHGLIYALLGTLIYTIVKRYQPTAGLDRNYLIYKIMATVVIIVASSTAFIGPLSSRSWGSRGLSNTSGPDSRYMHVQIIRPL